MTEPHPSTEPELVEFVRSIDVRAPDSLHQRVQALVADGSPRRARRGALGTAARPFGTTQRLAAFGAIAAAVIAVAIVVSLGGGGSSPLSLSQASALTLKPATAKAPAERNHTELTAAVEGLSFPYWEEHFGWRSTGARSDTVAGRAVTTIFYSNGRGRRIGYAIVAGATPLHPSGGTTSWHNGTPYRLLSVNGRTAVTWLRDGHLCVVSGRGVSAATLLRLASWDDHGTVAA
jgi:hypothetical protein